MLSKATYIWIDGARPTRHLRSKVRVLDFSSIDSVSLADFPQWGFDGSSTYQAKGKLSDLILTPVAFFKDPESSHNDYLVLCEVYESNGEPHCTNTRYHLKQVFEKTSFHEPFVGFEQEYTLFDGLRPLGWPEGGYPAPQGPFYCGAGADETFGRKLVEEHLDACIKANIMIFGVNAEVMPGQWEYQIGYRGIDSEIADPITVSDHLWISRWLLYKLGEKFSISAKLDPKPVKGDWNGAGKHANFSTKEMRNKNNGLKEI